MTRHSRFNQRSGTPTVAVELALISVSLVAAVALLRFGAVLRISGSASELAWLGALVSGIGYSSMFTVAPATIALGTLANQLPMWQLAVLGGLGAMIGDIVVFQFLQSAISRMLVAWAHAHRVRNRIKIRPRLRWPAMVLGALIVASPLPDEAGLALLGISHLPIRWLLPLSFLLNGIGIAVIGLAGRSLA